jgi:hypothetical protein
LKRLGSGSRPKVTGLKPGVNETGSYKMRSGTPVPQSFNSRLASRASAMDALILAIDSLSKCPGSSAGFTYPVSDSR